MSDLSSSEAYSLRQSGMPVDRRIREYVELMSIRNVQTGVLMTDDEVACTDPSHGPPLTTTKQYWGIRDENDWLLWAREEMYWVLENEEDIRKSGVIEQLRQAGWPNMAATIESVFSVMSAMRG
jgi:hypothetical protein